MFEEDLAQVLKEIEGGNNLGEKITLVGATKTVDLQTINRAVQSGLRVIGENKVQELRDKLPRIQGAEIHFIGRLQKNKVKYLIGNVSLIHSVDSVSLAEKINRLSEKHGTVTNILAEINIGGETSKTGFAPDEIDAAVNELDKLKNLRLKGLMAMFPPTESTEIKKLCLQMREMYDKMIQEGRDFEHLSMGMSGDYRIAIENGSNMIRLGSRIFGKRIYTGEK